MTATEIGAVLAASSVGEFVGGGQDVVGVVEPVHESGRVRLVGVEHATADHPVQRGAHADEPGQEPGGRALRHDAAPGEHVAEAAVLGGEPVVGGQDDRRTRADGRAADGRDDRLVHGEDRQRGAPCRFVVLGGGVVLGRGAVGEGFAAEVGADGEVVAVAGEHDHADVVVGVRAREGVGELVGHPHGVAVAALGPVQRDGGDGAVHLVGDLLVLLDRHVDRPPSSDSRHANGKPIPGLLTSCQQAAKWVTSG